MESVDDDGDVDEDVDVEGERSRESSEGVREAEDGISVYTFVAEASSGRRYLCRCAISPVSSALKTSVAASRPERAPSQISSFGDFGRTKRWNSWELGVGEGAITASESGSLKPVR